MPAHPFRRTQPRRWAPRLAVAGIAAAAVALSGCGGFLLSGQTTTQPGIVDSVQLQGTLCATSDGTNCTSSALSLPLSGVTYIQVYLGIQAPPDATPPATVTATPATGPAFTFTRDTGYETKLAAARPPAAGMVWRGYRATPTIVSSLPQFTFNASFGVPVTMTSFRWTYTGGWRLASESDAAYGFERPIVCGSPISGMATSPQTACDSAPTIAPAAFTLNRISLAARPGTIVAQPGTTAEVPFDYSSVQGNGTPQTFTLRTTTSLTGAGITDPADVGFDESRTVTARVAVPAGTPAGAYQVTLTLRRGAQTLRTATSEITVPPSPATPSTPAATTPAASAPTTTPATPPPPATLSDGTQTLAAALAAPGARAQLRKGRLRFVFTAPGPGDLRLSLLRPKSTRLPVLVVASAKRKVTRAGRISVPVRLTPAGRALVASKGRLRLRLRATFTQGGDSSVASRSVTIG